MEQFVLSPVLQVKENQVKLSQIIEKEEMEDDNLINEFDFDNFLLDVKIEDARESIPVYAYR